MFISLHDLCLTELLVLIVGVCSSLEEVMDLKDRRAGAREDTSVTLQQQLLEAQEVIGSDMTTICPFVSHLTSSVSLQNNKSLCEEEEERNAELRRLQGGAREERAGADHTPPQTHRHGKELQTSLDQ